MINIYKAGGNRKKLDGTEYSIKTINERDKSKFFIDGWVAKLDMVEVIEEAEFEAPVKPKARKTKAATS